MVQFDRDWDSWIRRVAEGDEEAGMQFWSDYGLRLQKLAQQNLSSHMQRRFAAEDVVQSVCRTFIRRARVGHFDVPEAGKLWNLLCAITLNKLRSYARFHEQQKRRVSDEVNLKDGQSIREPFTSGIELSPDDAAVFSDVLDQLFDHLDEQEQQLVELKLQQYTNDEISERLKCSERTIRRVVKRVQSKLRRILDDEV